MQTSVTFQISREKGPGPASPISGHPAHKRKKLLGLTNPHTAKALGKNFHPFGFAKINDQQQPSPNDNSTIW